MSTIFILLYVLLPALFLILVGFYICKRLSIRNSFAIWLWGILVFSIGAFSGNHVSSAMRLLDGLPNEYLASHTGFMIELTNRKLTLGECDQVGQAYQDSASELEHGVTVHAAVGVVIRALDDPVAP